MLDPLTPLALNGKMFDMERNVSVYSDNGYLNWWTKAWFNKKRKGEPSVKISRDNAFQWLNGEWEKDKWLEEFFPVQMQAYRKGMAKAKEAMINSLAAMQFSAAGKQ